MRELLRARGGQGTGTNFPDVPQTGGGMLDGIKAKLGFGSAQQYDDDGYADYGEYGYDENADYGEYGYADGGDDDPATRYEPHHSVSTRSALGYTRPVSSVSDSSRPRLVSIDDVRARTQVPESLNRDPLPPRRVTSASASRLGSFRGNRTVIDGKIPSTADSIAEAEAVSARATAGRERSESLDGLFASTATTEVPADEASADASSERPFDPYEAYSGSGATSHRPTRSITVLKPMSYGEAERISKGLKAGDAVVLALRNTPDPLVKRLLDFSFGVASALDAGVECIADKVFALTRGGALTDAEKAALRNQGVI